MSDAALGDREEKVVVPSAGALPAEPSMAARKLGYFAMVIGMFMAILDIQIVASSIGEIQAGLSASRDEVTWIQTSYLVAEVIMIPLTGVLARILSTRWLFVGSCVSFTLASVACAFTDTIEGMIFWRAAQGFLGGAMIPITFAAAYLIFPAQEKAKAATIAGLVVTLAPTLGPTIGGWITQTLSWHWLFLVNVVPGAVASILVSVLVRIDRPDFKLIRNFDVIGFTLMALALGSLQIVLEEGPREDWLQSEFIISFVTIAGLAFPLLFWRVLAARHPVVDVRVFVDRNFALGCIFGFLLGVNLYGVVYMLPVMLGAVRGYNSLQIGVVMAVTGFCQFLGAPLSAFFSRFVPPDRLLAFGIVLFALGLWFTTGLTHDVSLDELLLPQMLRGFALLFCFLPINIITLAHLPPGRLQTGAGLYNLTRNLGGAIGLASIHSLIEARIDLHRAHLVERLNDGRLAVVEKLEGLSNLLDTRLADAARLDRGAMRLLERMVEREATIMAFNDSFLLLTIFCVAALLLIPLLRPIKVPGSPTETH